MSEGPRTLVKRLAGLSAAALDDVFGPRPGPPVAMLLYHRISPACPGVPAPTMNVPPATFRRQLAGLLDLGFRFWPLRRLLAARTGGEPVPQRTLVVTFDDGFANVHAHAFPVLRDLGIPATVFLATAYLDTPGPFPFDPWAVAHHAHLPGLAYRPLTTGECHEMAASGLVELGAHTHTHQDFRARPDDFRADLAESVRVIRRLSDLEHPAGPPGPVTFAFPFGRRAAGYSGDELVAAARSTGVACALTTEGERVDPASDPFTWGRFNAYPFDTPATLAGKLGGWYGWAPALQGRVRQALRRGVA